MRARHLVSYWHDLTCLLLKRRKRIRNSVEIASLCRVKSTRGLHQIESQQLCDLFAKEVRKGAFRIPANATDDNILKLFCDHVTAESKRGVRYAWDPLRHLKNMALSKTPSEQLPITSLILYATWVENWLNMVITVAMLEQASSSSIYRTIRKKMVEKIDYLDGALGFPALSPILRKFILKLSRTRNGLVHFKWKGLTMKSRLALQKRILNLVQNAPIYLEELEKYEFAVIDARYSPVIKRLFPGCTHNN